MNVPPPLSALEEREFELSLSIGSSFSLLAHPRRASMVEGKEVTYHRFETFQREDLWLGKSII